MLCFPKLISHFPVPLSRLPEHKIGVFVRLFKEIWPLEAEKRANFCFCTLLSCYCLWGTAARAPGHLEPGTWAPGHRGTVAP